MAGAVVLTAVSVVATPAVRPWEVVATPSVVPWEAGPDVVKRSIVDPTPLGDSESGDDRRTPSTTPAKTTAPTAARTSQVARLLIVLSGFYAFIAQKEQSQRPARRRGLASSTSSVRLLLPPVTHGTWAGPHSFSIGTHPIGAYKAAVHSSPLELDRLVGRAFRAVRPGRAPLRLVSELIGGKVIRPLRRVATASDHSHLSASVPLAACRSPWRCGARASRASWLPRSGSRTTASGCRTDRRRTASP